MPELMVQEVDHELLTFTAVRMPGICCCCCSRVGRDEVYYDMAAISDLTIGS